MSLGCSPRPCSDSFKPDGKFGTLADLRHTPPRCLDAALQTTPVLLGYPSPLYQHTSRCSFGNCSGKELIPEAAHASRDEDVVEEEDGALPIMESALPFDRQAKQLYPVSITWQPPFTMLLDLKGHGDLQACLFAQLASCLIHQCRAVC